MARGRGIASGDQSKTTVTQQLKILGNNITKDAKKIVKSKHYDTGQLYHSIKSSIDWTSPNKFTIVISQIYYGQYVEKMDNPGYMEEAIEENIDQGIEDIINVQVDSILEEFITYKGNKIRYPKR